MGVKRKHARQSLPNAMKTLKESMSHWAKALTHFFKARFLDDTDAMIEKWTSAWISGDSASTGVRDCHGTCCKGLGAPTLNCGNRQVMRG